MFKSYVDSYLGTFEISCCEHYLREIKLVKEKEEAIQNNISKLVAKQLNEYFNYEREHFDVPIYFDDSFKSKVYKALYEVEYGQLVSYKGLADKISSRAYQAIGSAMATNPISIIVPCHRVIKSNGEFGEFFYGVNVKKQMIYFEKIYLLKKLHLEEKRFSVNEINNMKTHPVLSKMFTTMKEVDSFMKYKDKFECLVSQIIYQQVAFKVALNAESMLYDYLNHNVNPTTILRLSDSEFKYCGITGARIKYIRNVALFVNENLDFWNDIELLDESVVEKALLSIAGVGSWTVEMFLLFGLGKSDILSFGDLIIINGIKQLYEYDKVDKNTFVDFKSSVSGFETVVSINIWKYMEQGYFKGIANDFV